MLQSKSAVVLLLAITVTGCGGGASSSSSGNVRATKEYWAALQSPGSASQGQSQNKVEVIARMRSRAGEIEALPTKGVDPDAVDLGLAVAGFMRDYANALEHADASDQQFMVRSFVNGYTGNFQGAASDFSQQYAQRSNLASMIQQKTDLLNNRGAAVRAKLTQRYGVQFP